MNWPAVWVKMASSWLCVLIYFWTLFVPTCIPGQDFSRLWEPGLPQAPGPERDVALEAVAAPAAADEAVVIDEAAVALNGQPSVAQS